MCTLMERNGLAPPGWEPGKRSRPLAGEVEGTVSEIHEYVAGFILDREPVPALEVDTGDGRWRRLFETDTAQVGHAASTTAVILYFDETGCDFEYLREEIRVRIRPQEAADPNQ